MCTYINLCKPTININVQCNRKCAHARKSIHRRRSYFLCVVAFSKSNQTDPIHNCCERGSERKIELQINLKSDHKFYWWPLRIIQAAAICSIYVLCRPIWYERNAIYTDFFFIWKKREKKNEFGSSDCKCDRWHTTMEGVASSCMQLNSRT